MFSNLFWKRGTVWGLLAALAVLLTPTAAVRGSGEAEPEWEPDQALVRVLPGTDMAQFSTDYRCRVVQEGSDPEVLHLRVPRGTDCDALCTGMAADPRVLWAEPNLISSSPGTRSQWVSIFDGGTDPRPYFNQRAQYQVNLRTAHGRSTGRGVVVAILDTGVDNRHPALRGKLVPGWNAINRNAITVDRPNYRDDNANGFVDEATGHGTMVAGIVALVAPDAKLMPVRVLDSDGLGDLWTLAQGIRWAVDHGANVLNVSLGIPRNSDLLNEALEYADDKGAIVVTSAGNNSTDRPQFPAGVSRAVTVAAVTQKNKKAPFSNYGSDVDVCAPGVSIRSTNWNTRYAIWSGTSFAAPFVAGQAALVWSAYPRLSNGKVERIIEESARNLDELNPDYDGELGEGLIDIDRAVLEGPRLF